MEWDLVLYPDDVGEWSVGKVVDKLLGRNPASEDESVVANLGKTEAEKAARRRSADDAYARVKQARPTHWFPYDPVRVVHADP